jgi:hypothetical protein
MFVNLRIDLGQGESRGGTKYVFDYIVTSARYDGIYQEKPMFNSCRESQYQCNYPQN